MGRKVLFLCAGLMALYGGHVALKHIRHKKTPPSKNQPLSLEEVIQKSFLNQDEIDALYDLLEATDKILKKHHIPYSLEGGNLLGYFRNGGPIPWDDDIDIVIPEASEEAFLAAQEDLEAAGLCLIRDWRVFENGKLGKHTRDFSSKEKPLQKLAPHTDLEAYRVCFKTPKTKKNLQLDVLLMKPGKKGEWVLQSTFVQKHQPKLRFKSTLFSTLQQVQYGDLPHISCASQEVAFDYLDGYCGPSWKTEVNIYSHSGGHFGKFPLNADKRLSQYARRSKK